MKIKTFVLLSIFLVFSAVVAMTLFPRRPAVAPAGAARLKVVATLFPLYDMASAIGAG